MLLLTQPHGLPDDAILALDDTGIVIWASTAAERILGVESGAITGRSPFDYANGSSTDVNEASTARGSGERSQFVFKRRDGELVEVFQICAPSRSGVNVVGAIWVMRLAWEDRMSNGGTIGCDTAAKSFLESGSEGAFQLTPDGRFIFASTSFSEICGYDTAAAFLTAVDGGLHHHYVEMSRHDELLQRLRESGAITRFESAIHRRDGTTTWISENVRAVLDHSGKVQHYAGTAQDIGWRKLAEEILNQAEEKWRAVVESSSECIVIADPDGVVLFANSKAQRSGIGLPGTNVFSALSPPSQRDLRASIDLAFQARCAEVLDLERAPSGADCAWYEVRVVPIGNVDSVARVILIATDLTGRKRAEEAVREGQRLIGRVADASPAILYVYDSVTERYVYVNHQVEKILGYAAEDFLAGGKALFDKLVHEDDAGLLTERTRLLAESRDDGVVFEYTFRMRHAGGQWLWIRARDVVFTRDADGRPVQIIGMAEDVTERRRAGQERERSREQLRALSARLQDAREEERAAISRRVHDELGQALTALSWELSKLTHQLQPPTGSQPEIAARLSGMDDMMDAMMQIVRKVAAELRPPILDHFGLAAAIEWQAKEFQERYRITCEVSARSRHAIPDRAMSTAVFRIFQEILTNVARHSRATKVRVQFNDSPRGFALIVHDNGCGITEGQKSQSLGILGMRERAHLFGGSIEIEGAAGKGTTVTVHIPKASGTSQPGPRKETLRPPP